MAQAPQNQKRYLKVMTPVTSDGKTLVYDEQRRPIFRTTYLPISAKAAIMRSKSKLPEYLRPIISEEKND